MLIILLVCFTMVMFVWLLGNLGAIPTGEPAGGAGRWLPFFACLILGIMVFLVGTGTIVIEPVMRR
jgi:hypothetical protein